jgi:hypothetical protein
VKLRDITELLFFEYEEGRKPIMKVGVKQATKFGKRVLGKGKQNK